MEFLELVKLRQSVRSYDASPVEREKIMRCVEAARLAPSASNSQPWKFIIVDDPGLCKLIADASYGTLGSFNRFTPDVTTFLVMVIEKMKLVTQIGAHLKDREFSLIDIGIAAEHFCLQAAEEGIGTCMIGWFNEDPIKKALNIPMSKRIGLLISVGYPGKEQKVREKKRKSVEEVLCFNNYL